jgi:hypothetical protein
MASLLKEQGISWKGTYWSLWVKHRFCPFIRFFCTWPQCVSAAMIKLSGACSFICCSWPVMKMKRRIFNRKKRITAQVFYWKKTKFIFKLDAYMHWCVVNELTCYIITLKQLHIKVQCNDISLPIIPTEKNLEELRQHNVR